MIVGIDASRANHDQKTGVEWYCFHLLQQMKEIRNPKSEIRNHRIILYSPEPLKGELAILPSNWESKVLRWPPKRLWTQVRLSIEMLLHPPDVLFIPAHVFPIIHPKKTVMTVHDIAAARFPYTYSSFERWYSLWSAKYAVEKLWKVIVPSHFVKDEITKTQKHKNTKTIESDRVSVIHHGYDQRYQKIDDAVRIDAVLQKYGIRKPFLLSVGRLEEKKNTAKIVESFNQISLHLTPSTFHLVLIGTPGHGYEKVKAAIEQSPYKEKIKTPGWIAPDDLVYIMNAAAVFVFPSLYEGFGLPILEAMAAGVPVVTSTGSCLKEVGGEAAVYVDPMSAEDIAQGILSLLAYSELRIRKIQQGLAQVKEFSWQRAARETLVLMTE